MPIRAPFLLSFSVTCFSPLHRCDPVAGELADALQAQQLQNEVAEAAVQTADWLRHNVSPELQDLAKAPLQLQHGELCRLCLMPTAVVQLPVMHLQSGMQCLVSLHSLCSLLYHARLHAVLCQMLVRFTRTQPLCNLGVSATCNASLRIIRLAKLVS